MEKPVIISIRGVQSLEPGEEDVMELVTQGVLRQEEGEGFSLSYLESELTGLEGTTTTFRIAPDRITLRREGTLNSEMIFQEGQKHVSLYETPYGELSVDIQTSALRHNLSDRGGLLEIRYSIAVEHTVTGRNSFKIRVKRKN